MSGGGEPGGDGGIWKFGTGGMVRFRSIRRPAVYGDDGTEPSSSSLGIADGPASGIEGPAAGPAIGPSAGPRAGPDEAGAGSSAGSGVESGCGSVVDSTTVVGAAC